MVQAKLQRIDVDSITIPSPHTNIWLEIGALNLTESLRDTLIHPLGWLTDQLLDAAQHLIRVKGLGIAGPYNITAMTHHRNIMIEQAREQAIQCHNIGHHWVTSSTISGSIIVYESFSTNLNEALKRQLVHMCRYMSKDDGQPDVTVVLQQKQKGGSDCDLFAIANAVTLSSGVDPGSVVWEQNKMRPHLLKGYEKQKISMFPHLPRSTCTEKEHYTISVYCVCLKHITAVELLECSVCRNKYHYGLTYCCIKLTSIQATAALSGNPFVCHRCSPN
eukprot:gene8388-9286_t